MGLHHFYLRPHSRTESQSSSLPVSPLLRDFPSPSTRKHASDVTQQLSNMSRSPSMSTFPNNSAPKDHTPSTPTNVHPPPAYVGTFGASQVVSDSKRHFSDDEDDDAAASSNKAGHGDMDFSPAALVLLNAFLDQLLYSILSVAKSTTLTALRPAVVEVLKARLASEAIASAEEELQELLAGGEEEEDEMNDRQTKSERQRRWDTELVWKRTRLRVMVYIRLGEMEDDDEERFVREDELFAGNDRRFSQSTGLVSWAAAIFLTSVVEFVAEQVLTVSSQAAASRARRRSRILRVSLAAPPAAVQLDGPTIVEEGDMEKVALSSTLGRLWRTWRKSIRNNANATQRSPTPTNPLHRALDRDNAASPALSQPHSRDMLAGAGAIGTRRDSSGTVPDSMSAKEDPRAMSAMSVTSRETPENEAPSEVDEEPPEAEYPEHILAANIPIIVLDERRDVDEIEVPGLARDPDAAMPLPVQTQPQRRHSFSGPISLIRISAAAEASEVLASDVSENEPAEVASLEDATSEAIAPEEDISGAAALEEDKPDVDGLEVAVAPRQRSRSEPVPVLLALHEEVPVEEVDGGDAGGDAVGDKPEQKANAAEMASLKRKVSPGKSSAAEASKEVASEAELAKDDDAASAKGSLRGNEEALSEDESATAEKGHKGLVGGAVAAASAAAAAAVTLVSGSKGDDAETDSRAGAGADTVTARGQSLDVNHEGGSPLAERLSSGSLREEPQILESKQVSLSPPPTPQRLIRTHTTSSSKDSFSLDDGNGEKMPVRPLAMPRHLSNDLGQEQESEDVDIGVARTSDTAVSTPRGEHPPEVQARDSFSTPARRSGRLVLGTSTPDAPSPAWRESPSIERQASGTTPEDFLHKRSLSVSTSQQSEKSKPRSPNEQARTPVPASNRASVPSALVINEGEKVQPEKTPSPWRQSFSAAVEKNAGWVSPKKKASFTTADEPEVPIQEHPVVQKIATMKRKESKYQEDENAPLTSANIKGPADFEMFVQGGDTVKYTLTPENVRDDPVSIIELAAVLMHQNTDTWQTFSKPARVLERTVSPEIKESSAPIDSRMGRSQAAKQTTSSRIIIEPDADVDVDDTMNSRTSRDTKRRSVSRPVARNTSVHRRSGLMAREPQVVTESTRDFADFIRSTGPARDPEVLPIVTNRSSASSVRSQSRPASVGATSVRSMNRSTKPGETVPPVPSVPSGKSRSNMQPRSATSAADGSSELIDFIRSGPNLNDPQDEQRQHRISRSVAPFRTTMDSDQLVDWGERLANSELKSSADASPSARSASRSSFKSSFRTSGNSKSALLAGPSTANEPYHPAHSNQPPTLSLPRSVLPDANEPVRKRVRSKDPYAIDMFDDDDDDDDGLLTALPKTQPQQESLIEFLRNSGPNTPNEPAAITTTTSASSRGPTPTFPPRRSSNQGLKTFGADAVSMGRRGSGPNRDTSQQRNQSAPRNGTTSIAVGPITKPRSQLEARGDSNGANGTLDLSDYLRSSGPDANAAAARQSSKVAPAKPERKKSGRMSFFAFFSRSSKSARPANKQYLDM